MCCGGASFEGFQYLKKQGKDTSTGFIGYSVMPVYIDAAAMGIIPLEYTLKGRVCGNSFALILCY